MQGFVKEKEFYKQAACIAIPISLQSVITIGVSFQRPAAEQYRSRLMETAFGFVRKTRKMK